MELKGKTVVLTGAGSGIGAPLARRFADEGARMVVCSDRDAAASAAVTSACGGVSIEADVSGKRTSSG